MHQLVITSCGVRFTLLVVALGASVNDSARPMVDVAVPVPPAEVPMLCLRDRLSQDSQT